MELARPLEIPLKPMERLWFRSPLVAVGRNACAPGDPLFPDSGPSLTHAFAFARTCTLVQPGRGPSFVEGPDVVSFFNRGDPYRQRRVSPEGVRCDWFVVADEILQAAVRRRAGRKRGRLHGNGDAPFPASHAPCDASLYLRQRRIVNAIRRGRLAATDVEEAVLRLLEDAIEALERAHPAAGSPPRSSPRARRDLVAGAQAILAETYGEPLRLAAVADELKTSVSHLCRVFRARTGVSLSGYRRTLRLRAALERLDDPAVDVGALADGLGFCSPSHFAFAFRRVFGITPTAFRRTAARAC